MLCNNPHVQLLLPAGPAQATDSAMAARRGGCQFAGIRLLLTVPESDSALFVE